MADGNPMVHYYLLVHYFSTSLALSCSAAALHRESQVARHAVAHRTDTLQELLLYAEALAQEGPHVLAWRIRSAKQ